MATKRKEEWEKIQRKGMKYKTKELKRNEYDVETFNYGIGYCNNGNYFLFDKELYDIIRNYKWITTSNNYVIGKHIFTKELILLHHLVTDFKKEVGFVIDHINRNKYDNRKENLRIATNSQNNMNMSTYQKTLDKSGVKGVTWDKTKNMWQSTIRLNGKLIKLGHFKKDDLKSAIICRLKAEKEYFGEYSAQQHLFENYNI